MIKRNKLFLFWSFIGAVALATVAFLPWRFQVNDDVTMMWLVSGAYTGTPEPYAVFIHPILSWVFAFLYTGFFWIPWYEGVWFSGIYISFLLLLGNILRSKSPLLVKNLLLFFLLLISIHFSIFPQFTLVAGYLVFSSLVVLMDKGARYSNWVAFLLLALGIMIRWESAVLIFLGYIFYAFFSTRKKLGFKFSSKIGAIILLFVGLIASKAIYETNSPYADFLRFNRMRSAVIDHPVFYQDILEKNISYGSEWFFFSRWYFEDQGISEADLQEKKLELDTYLFSIDHTLDSLVRLWRFFRFEAFKSFLIMGILFFFLLLVRKVPFLIFFLGAWMLFFLVFNHFYLIQGRVIFLFFLCLLFPVFEVGIIHIDRRVSIGLFALLFLALGFHLLNFLREGKGRAVMDQEFLTLQNHLSPSTPLIIEGYHEQNWGMKFSAIDPVPFISTGWISRSDFQKKALQRMGISSFATIEKFALITPTVNQEIVFPDYMNHAFGTFIQTDSVRSANFILLQFEKKTIESH